MQPIVLALPLYIQKRVTSFCVKDFKVDQGGKTIDLDLIKNLYPSHARQNKKIFNRIKNHLSPRCWPNRIS